MYANFQNLGQHGQWQQVPNGSICPSTVYELVHTSYVIHIDVQAALDGYGASTTA